MGYQETVFGSVVDLSTDTDSVLVKLADDSQIEVYGDGVVELTTADGTVVRVNMFYMIQEEV